MPFSIEDLPQVALPGLNQLHAEEVVMINALSEHAAAGDAAFAPALQEFLEHLAKHFEIERTNMERTEYPERAAHLAEHDGIDARVAELEAADDAGAWHAFFADELPKWFVEHVATHDTPTAEHVVAHG